MATVRIGQIAVRVVALAVLVLGIVVMHHVARPGHDASIGDETSLVQPHSSEGAPAADEPPTGATSDDSPVERHDLLHLCLSVMTTVVVLLIGRVLLALRRWRRSGAFEAFRPPAMVATRAPPRPHGSALLVSLCVLRT